MQNSQIFRSQAVRDRLMAIIHNAAEAADLSLEVCVDESPDGSGTLHLEITTRPVPFTVGQSVPEVLRALEDQTELFIHDLRDFDAQLRNIKVSDTRTGIYLAQSGDEILFASTCQAETEEYLADLPNVLEIDPTFIPVPLEDISKTLRLLASQGVDVPEIRKFPPRRRISGSAG